MKQNVKKMSSPNIDKMSLKDLVDLEAKVQKAIATARDRERALVKEKMAEMAKTHGFSVNELFGGGRAEIRRVVDEQSHGSKGGARDKKSPESSSTTSWESRATK